METITRPGTPRRHRMLDDMRMRKFAEHTQAGYIRAVRKLAAFLGRSPDTATTEDLRRFQLHLVDAGTGPDGQLAAPAPTFVCGHCGNAMVVLQVFLRDASIRAPPVS